MGAEIQRALGDSTGRATVPNVLISGKSVGGGDDMIMLHAAGKLVDLVKSMGGKRIVEVKVVSEGGENRGEADGRSRRMGRRKREVESRMFRSG